VPKNDLTYIDHIVERAEKILLFIEGMTENDFLQDEKTQSAVIREFEVIGEASKRVSESFKNHHPDIPWKLITGMRDVLIHDYEGVDPYAVWDTIQNDLHPLIDKLKISLTSKDGPNK